MLDQVTVTKDDVKPVIDYCKANPFLILTCIIVDAAIAALYNFAKKEVSK